MSKTSGMDFLVTKKLREKVPDLLLLHLWELYEKHSDVMAENPKVFKLFGVQGQVHTQIVSHQINSKKLVKHIFQTAIPTSAKIVVYDIDGAVIMLSEEQADDVFKQYYSERGCLYENQSIDCCGKE